MIKDFGLGLRGSSVARHGLSVLFTLVAACGGDDEEETGAGSETTVAATDSTGPGEGTTTTGAEGTTTTGEESTGPEPGTDSTTAADESSSGGESTTGEPFEEVFFPEVLAIIQAECSCHRSPMPAAQLDLSDDAAYDSLVNVPSGQAPGVNRVTPGDPDNSYLYLKLTGEQASVGGGGTRMPQGGVLPDDQILLVRNWIGSGAQL